MNYKGYTAKVYFDEEAEIFHGEILGIKDVVTFQGTTVSDLKKEFEESVEDYLEFCAERGEEPDKPFSGKFMVRIDPLLHRKLYEQSSKAGESLNGWIESKLTELSND
ncbi:MAG: type II toxin-antitoxin system HicB family antitoxin [Verrucomicrobiota bacterium]